jgi:hypothetical protein
MHLNLLLCCVVGAVNCQFNFVGAMENWGLITYRETCLLVDPENTSTVQKQWIALTVGHEIAHQWFGNLVTMVRSCMLEYVRVKYILSLCLLYIATLSLQWFFINIIFVTYETVWCASNTTDLYFKEILVAFSESLEGNARLPLLLGYG